jgi:hypothetical protein
MISVQRRVISVQKCKNTEGNREIRRSVSIPSDQAVHPVAQHVKILLRKKAGFSPEPLEFFVKTLEPSESSDSARLDLFTSGEGPNSGYGLLSFAAVFE